MPEHADHIIQLVLTNVHHQANFAFCLQARLQHQCDVVDLVLDPGIAAGGSVGNEPSCALKHFVQNTQIVGTQ